MCSDVLGGGWMSEIVSVGWVMGCLCCRCSQGSVTTGFCVGGAMFGDAQHRVRKNA